MRLMKPLIICTLFVMMFPAAASAHYSGELLPDSVAVMEYSMIISMTPNDTLTRNKLGMVYVRQNKLDKAREQFMEILKIDPKNFDALDSLGIVCDKEAKYAEAVGWYGKAIKIRPNDPGVHQRYEAAAGNAKSRK